MMSDVLAPPSPVLSNAMALPLCVDLDGTLVRSDTLVEGFFAFATNPRVVGALLRLAGGRAAFKQAVAAGAELDPALLPYNETLLAYLRVQKAAGRRLVLATAADQRIARAVAVHLGIFDEVVASDGTSNLKGEAKARALVGRFGAGGFVYAGDSAADVPIWRQAAAVILVNAPAGVASQVRGSLPVELAIDDRPALLPELLKAMRPHQWVKNVLAFVPILTAHALGEASAWIGGIVMFLAFCFTASAIYLVNDLLDIAADRAHPRKRLRPFARGAVPLPIGAAVAVVLLVAGVGLALIGHVAWIVALYALMSVSYSFGLKQLPLVDVFMLGALYTIRLFGGGEATGHRLSLWLLGFSSFLFLSLALLKRVEEMMSVGSAGGSRAARRGYSAADTPILQLFGVAAAFASSIVLALFVQSEATAQHYASPSLLWFVVPLLLFWQCRMWLSGARGYMHHDPIVYAARDWVSWAIGAATAAVLIAAKSIALFAG
jgi:4-hydroxybenzoate polyprenyltransferase/phosphoserine phosphatase